MSGSTTADRHEIRLMRELSVVLEGEIYYIINL